MTAAPAPSHPSRRVTTAIFDLGNVLITWDRELLYSSVIPDPERRSHFLDNVLTMDENARLDRGMGLAELTADLAGRHPDWAEEIDAFRTRWIETIGPVIANSVEVLTELSDAGVPLYALSNFGAETFEQVRNHYPWFAHFDGMVISGQEGVVKPEPEIWLTLLERFGEAASSCVFIDDAAVNVEAAAAMGFATVHFTPDTDLRAELVTLGLV